LTLFGIIMHASGVVVVEVCVFVCVCDQFSQISTKQYWYNGLQKQP